MCVSVFDYFSSSVQTIPRFIHVALNTRARVRAHTLGLRPLIYNILIQLIGCRPCDRAGLWRALIWPRRVSDSSRRLMWPLVAALLMEQKSYITRRKSSQLSEIEQLCRHKPQPGPDHAQATHSVTGLVSRCGVSGPMFQPGLHSSLTRFCWG